MRLEEWIFRWLAVSLLTALILSGKPWRFPRDRNGNLPLIEEWRARIQGSAADK